MSPIETGAAIGGVASFTVGTAAVVANRGKQVWQRAFAALKLSEIEQAAPDQSTSELAALERANETLQGGASGKKGEEEARVRAFNDDGEVAGETSLHKQLMTAMRSRVSDRRTVERSDFATRRTRYNSLTTLKERVFDPALRIAQDADSELSAAARDRSGQLMAEAAARASEQVVEHDRDGNGRPDSSRRPKRSRSRARIRRTRAARDATPSKRIRSSASSRRAHRPAQRFDDHSPRSAIVQPARAHGLTPRSTLKSPP